MPAKSKPVRTSERELVTTYIFDAPSELVWKAWTDPKLIPRWWGPRRYTTTVEKMEVRPGGTWRFIQRDAEGNVYGFHGEYKEVVPPKRIVDTFEYEGMPGRRESGLVITRIFDAPRERVWKACTDPGEMKKWWGPKGFTTPVLSADLRIGGVFRYCMRSPEGKDYWGTGVYREIVLGKRL